MVWLVHLFALHTIISKREKSSSVLFLPIYLYSITLLCWAIAMMHVNNTIWINFGKNVGTTKRRNIGTSPRKFGYVGKWLD